MARVLSIAEAAERVARIFEQAGAKLPDFIAPQLCKLLDRPTGEECRQWQTLIEFFVDHPREPHA